MTHQMPPTTIQDSHNDSEEGGSEEGVALAVFTGVELEEEDGASNQGAVEDVLPGSGSTLLQELESRQDDVLEKLDQLNDRIEQTLAEMGRLPKEPKSAIPG